MSFSWYTMNPVWVVASACAVNCWRESPLCSNAYVIYSTEHLAILTSTFKCRVSRCCLSIHVSCNTARRKSHAALYTTEDLSSCCTHAAAKGPYAEPALSRVPTQSLLCHPKTMFKAQTLLACKICLVAVPQEHSCTAAPAVLTDRCHTVPCLKRSPRRAASTTA